ncbi:hypothetical protein NUW58_g4434 [Xylaria curta]|uniref:Uncharacterized protein n=1 Tax=Xylaria curta TaxID=42375 RepID=A0ACC1P7W4_9PEZI|nr:hypothetical protein NUW58_g4434 [Xylaria curta]
MTTPEQNLPTAGGQTHEASNTSDGSSTQQAVRLSQASNANEAPPLPQRTSTQPQTVLPQPFSSHQPLYVPYAGQPNQQPAYMMPARPLPKQSSAYIATRLGLTVLSSIWGIIIIALTSILLSSGGNAAAVSLYAYAVVIVSILWNTAELITYCVRLRKEVQRGIHPGAHVGLHLIFWLAGVLSTLLSVTVYVGVARSVQNCERGDSYAHRTYSYCDYYEPISYYKWNILPVLRALIAIFALWTVNHFVLFVLACIETQKRNLLKPTGYVVPLSAVPTQGMYYYPQPAGTQSMPPVLMQPQPAHLAAVEPRNMVSNEKQTTQPQNLAGFYASVPAPSAQAPSSHANAALGQE